MPNSVHPWIDAIPDSEVNSAVPVSACDVHKVLPALALTNCLSQRLRHSQQLVGRTDSEPGGLKAPHPRSMAMINEHQLCPGCAELGVGQDGSRCHRLRECCTIEDCCDPEITEVLVICHLFIDAHRPAHR